MNRSPDQPNGRTRDAHAATTGTLMSSLRLDRLVHDAVDLARDDARLADGQLEALAPHLLDEDRERELAAVLTDVDLRPDVSDDGDVADLGAFRHRPRV